jgi:hypothetical protein
VFQQQLSLSQDRLLDLRQGDQIRFPSLRAPSRSFVSLSLPFNLAMA